MAILIITPQYSSGIAGVPIGSDVIAYYPLNETENFTKVFDVANNFHGTTAATSRVTGYDKYGLPLSKSGSGNFVIDKVLDEIPATKKFTIEFWLKLTEEIRTGEHRTYSFFSKSWTSGMRLFAYFVCRLESLQLHFEYHYLDVNAQLRKERKYVTIEEGIIPANIWHKVYIQLDLRDGTQTNTEAWYSKYGIFFGDYYICSDTQYFVNIPMNFALTPVVIGGDEANLVIGDSNSAIEVAELGLPFPSSNRYGIDGVLDEVIIRKTLINEMIGTTERPRLYVVKWGDGEVVKNPDQISYLPEDDIELTSEPASGWSWRRWHLAQGTIASNTTQVAGTVDETTYNAGSDTTTISIKEDLVPGSIPVLPDGATWKIKFTSGDLSGQEFEIVSTSNGTPDTIVISGDHQASENDTFLCFPQNQTVNITEDLVPIYIPAYESPTIIYQIKMTSGTRKDEYFNIIQSIDGTPDQFVITQEIEEGVYGGTYSIQEGDTFDIVAVENPITITMPTVDRTIYAEFGGIYHITLTIEGEGTVDIYPYKEDYGPNEQVEFTGNPESGWYFAYWTINGTRYYDNPLNWIMTDDLEITATFKVESDILYINHNDPDEATEPRETVSDVVYINHDETT